MRHDKDYKLVRMVALDEITSGAAFSATTYGSTGSTRGVADTTDWERCRLELRFLAATNTACQIKTLKVGFMSAVSTLFASSTVFSGRTSGIVLSAITTKCGCYAVDFPLHNNGSRKRYMTCKVVYSGGTSAIIEVAAYLYKGAQFPAGTLGYTAAITTF